MSKPLTGGRDRGRHGIVRCNALAATARFLALAAAPTFAIMAVLTSALESGAQGMMCSTTIHAASLNGMAVMYVLMSVSCSTLAEADLRRTRRRTAALVPARRCRLLDHIASAASHKKL